MTGEVQDVEHCDLVIVGAGIAGLNALFAATKYLAPDQKVVLLDERPGVGGMWLTTYDYVRLHQPHSVFTVGNIKWTLDEDRGYLANKQQVLHHLRYCLEVLKRRVVVDELLGWDMDSHVETDGEVTVECASSDGRRKTLVTPRLINAYGVRVLVNPPLDVASRNVTSVSPDTCDVRTDMDDDKPVWIIGGGKTAMDTAHALITRYPGRSVNLVAGSGTYFGRREAFFAPGHRRWWRGTTITEAAIKAARRFTGHNEADVAEWYRGKYGIFCTPTADSYLMGLLCTSENDVIEAGLDQIVMGRFDTVVDDGEATILRMKTGASPIIERGSWIVNCTGYIKANDQPYEPYISDGGRVLSIQNRSATMHLSSFAGYFLTHLFFLDKLRDAPLYEVDLQELLSRRKFVAPWATFALVQYNCGVLATLLPRKVFSECGLDFDLWYAPPRRWLAKLRALWATRPCQRARFRATLDTVHQRSDTAGIRCGLLPSVAKRLAEAAHSPADAQRLQSVDEVERPELDVVEVLGERQFREASQ